MVGLVMAKGISFKWRPGQTVQWMRTRRQFWHQQIPILRRIGQYVTEITKTSFDRQADPETGSPWRPLSSVYAAWKAKKGYSAQALVKTKRLKNSISFSLQQPSVFIGPSAVYGQFHQLGRGVPARPFMGLNRTHEIVIERMAATWVNKGIT